MRAAAARQVMTSVMHDIMMRGSMTHGSTTHDSMMHSSMMHNSTMHGSMTHNSTVCGGMMHGSLMRDDMAHGSTMHLAAQRQEPASTAAHHMPPVINEEQPVQRKTRSVKPHNSTLQQAEGDVRRAKEAAPPTGRRRWLHASDRCSTTSSSHKMHAKEKQRAECMQERPI